MKKNKSLPLISQDNRKEKNVMPLISYIGYAESGEEIEKLVEKCKNDIEEEKMKDVLGRNVVDGDLIIKANKGDRCLNLIIGVVKGSSVWWLDTFWVNKIKHTSINSNAIYLIEHPNEEELEMKNNILSKKSFD
jgi:hypothetical protein